MNKNFLLFFFLLLYCSFSYASFPIANQVKQVSIETDMSNEIKDSDISLDEPESTCQNAIISLLLVPVGFLFFVFTLGSAFASDEVGVVVFALLTIASYIGAVVFGVRSLIRKEKGFFLALLGVILGVLGVGTLLVT